jgi:hypothetical protein
MIRVYTRALHLVHLVVHPISGSIVLAAAVVEVIEWLHEIIEKLIHISF